MSERHPESLTYPSEEEIFTAAAKLQKEEGILSILQKSHEEYLESSPDNPIYPPAIQTLISTQQERVDTATHDYKRHLTLYALKYYVDKQ